MRQIFIREVGPRDGLQNARQLMPTDVKKAWIKAIAEAGVSTAFGCTMQGDVPEDDVVRIAAALAGFCDHVSLADTVGYANPAQIKRLFSKVRKEIGSKLRTAHLHNTRG